MKAFKWMSGLCCAIFLTNYGAVSAADKPNLTEKQAVYNQDNSNVTAARDYAVALAQAGEFTQSLEVFKKLYEMYPDNKEVAMDYLVVLNWAGENRGAVEIFERLKTSDQPSYVKTSAAGAYYQLGDYPKALRLYREVAVTGDRKAQIWYAQTLVRAGEAEKGFKAYQELIERSPDDIEVYLSRASSFMFTSQYSASIVDYEKALSLAPQGEAGALKRRQIEHDMAVSYIRAGDEGRAIVLLKPYIESGTADVFMQADYILALRLNTNYKAAILEGERLWQDYGKVPNFGLQALGDCYLRTGRIQKATDIYNYLLKRDPNSNSVKIGLAFSYVASGHIEKGITIYRQTIKTDPALAGVALDDAYYFVSTGRFAAGKAIYSLIVDQFPENALFRQEMAYSLLNDEMPRQAYEQFQFLAQLPGGEQIGNSGMADSARIVGDYNAAATAVSVLRNNYSTNAISQAAIANYDKRRRGGMETSYVYSFDYKGIEARQFIITADQNIGGSYSVLAAIGHTRITDRDANESSSLTNRAMGLQYVDMKYDAKLWLDNYLGQGTFNGYRVLTNYYLDDHSIVNFDFEKTPVLDTQALSPANNEGFGRIMASNYTLGFRRQVGVQTTYSVNFTRGLYNDGNQVNSYGFRRDQTLFDKGTKSVDWFVFASRSNFKFQQINGVDTVYESPVVRQIYGTGFTQRWLIPKGYWEGTLSLEWGCDRPEPTDFSPNFRLEYGHNFSQSHRLILGAEYGLRTNRLADSSNLNFGYRQYDLSYQIDW